jgi:hypothetical protein
LAGQLLANNFSSRVCRFCLTSGNTALGSGTNCGLFDQPRLQTLWPEPISTRQNCQAARGGLSLLGCGFLHLWPASQSNGGRSNCGRTR